MRLLWEEDLFGATGAIIVAALSLATVWLVLEGLMQLPGLVSVLLATLGGSRGPRDDQSPPLRGRLGRARLA